MPTDPTVEPSSDPPVETILHDLLRHAMEQGASDVHIKAGSAPHLRVEGTLRTAPFPVLTAEDTDALARAVLPPVRLAEFEHTYEADVSFSVSGVGRFRVNLFRQRGSAGMVLRRVLPAATSLRDLGLPPTVESLADQARGLVLVTGPTGSGKTTTLAGMLDHINRTRAVNIVTIEDPIEVMHADQMAIVNQREIGSDTVGYAEAMRRVLRQDPDVILVGEMRDPETVATALAAAETGHLVLSTLHTSDAAETVNRIIDFFPAEQHLQVRRTLASNLRGVVCQRLIVGADGHRRAACEVMVVTGRVAEWIVAAEGNGDAAGIEEIIAAGDFYGMQTFDQSLAALFRAGLVTLEGALDAASHGHDLLVRLQQEGLVATR
jgi:twitching motility protein PilT